MLKLFLIAVALMNASLDLANLVQAPGDPIDKVARLHQLYVDLLNEMESMEKECAKNKARADRLNEEREKGSLNSFYLGSCL